MCIGLFQKLSFKHAHGTFTIPTKNCPWKHRNRPLRITRYPGSLKFDLSWDLQVTKISKRVYFTLHNLYHFKQYLSVDLKTRLFKQIILPHFMYASAVFSGTLSSSNMKTLSRALRTAVRFVYDRGRRDSISSFVLKLLFLPFRKVPCWTSFTNVV